MADNNRKTTTVSAKATTKDTDKSQQQKLNAEKLEAKKKEADKKAMEAREEAERQKKEAEERKKKEEEERKRKEAEEAARKAEEERIAKEEADRRTKEMLATAGQLAAAGGALAATAAKASKSKFNFLKGLLIGLVVGLLVGGGFVWYKMRKPVQIPAVAGTVEQVEDHDLTIDNDNILGYTAADFENAVLGAASEHQELIVMEQPLSIETTITQAGLGNLAIFSKMKSIIYSGTGVYTVDLSQIDQDHINVNETDKIITIYIPHTVLQYIVPDLKSAQFNDTEKGMLSFGDIKLTPEEQNELEIAVENAMRERLDMDDMYEAADRFAALQTWEIFQPLVSAVSPEFIVEMEFTLPESINQ